MNYRAMIQNRRSVHAFREKEVPREAIGQLRSYDDSHYVRHSILYPNSTSALGWQISHIVL